MEKDVNDLKNTQKQETVKPRIRTEFNSVVFVQAAVCAFFILLVFLAWKLSPSTFQFIKDEFGRIMSIDMSADELAESARDAAQDVMNALPSEEVTTAEATGEEEEIPEGTGGEDKESAAVAVVATLGKNDKITVPLHGRITSRYGYRTNPISGKYGLHTGLDIAAAEGTGIVAAYNGVIKDTGYGTKKGKYVLMEHSDGTKTLYCHCSEILVDEGTVIRAGEVIALVGSTGWSTGPHLHFEIQNKNGWSTDPLDVLTETDGRV
ncbi:MAG: M23 family metallopeptidase [Clostridia bacterium]|nr:M23 family metallopeptidase [Clostridia bacterium]